MILEAVANNPISPFPCFRAHAEMVGIMHYEGVPYVAPHGVERALIAFQFVPFGAPTSLAGTTSI
jgi:hypothetical protein